MLGVSVTLAFLAALPSSPKSADVDNPFVFTNQIGMRFEVVGACNITDNDVTAWDTKGKLSEALRKEVIEQANRDEGRYYTFDFGRKTRNILLRISGPSGLTCRASEGFTGSSRYIRYEFGVLSKPQLYSQSVSVDPTVSNISIGFDIPRSRTLLASFAPTAKQKATYEGNEIRLDSIARFQEGSVIAPHGNAMIAEVQLLSFNDKAWTLNFTVPAVQAKQSIKFKLETKDGKPLKSVDIDGKPSDGTPDWPKLMKQYERSMEPDPKTYVNYVQLYPISISSTKTALATNINPKYLKAVSVYLVEVATTKFWNIPLDPISN